MPFIDELNDELTAIRVKDMSAGQFSFQHPSDKIVMPPNSAEELLNIDIDTMGRRKKRKGYEMIADDLGSSKIDGMSAYNPIAGTRVLVCESNGTVYTWANTGNWASSLASMTAQNQAELVEAKGLLFRLSQVDNIRSLDGTSWTDEGNTNTDFPKVKMAIWTSNQRMLGANTTAAPGLLYYSDSGAPQTFNRTTNVFRIGKGDDDGITGMIEFTNREVVVFTLTGMYSLNISDSSPSYWIRAKISDIGCIAFRTVRQVGTDALFLADDGVRSVIQSAQDKKRGDSLPLSFPIQDWIERINKQYAYLSTATVWSDKYLLSVPIDGSTICNYTLLFSRRAYEANGQRGGWTVYENFNFNAWAVQTFNGKKKLYGGESQADGKVYEVRSSDPDDDATSDNGTAIEYSETGKRQDFDTPESDKTFEFIEVEVLAKDTGEVSVEAQIDGGGYTKLGTFDQGEGLPELPVALPFDLTGANIVRAKYDLESLGRGRDIQIRLKESTLDTETEILGYTISGFVENVDTN